MNIWPDIGKCALLVKCVMSKTLKKLSLLCVDLDNIWNQHWIKYNKTKVQTVVGSKTTVEKIKYETYEEKK